jgi:ketosteroid isomerase-like protein
MSDSRSSDKQQILDHIHSIFKAFLARDRDTIRAAHTSDWTGFQGPSTGIERGIEAYMANVEKSLDAFEGTGYELIDTEVQLYGDMAVVYYVARYDYKGANGVVHGLPLRSIDIYRRDDGHWNQCGSHITPIPGGSSWGESE